MPDYGGLFAEGVAQGLGLGPRPQIDPEEAARTYRADPADAFTRAAALAQPPGDGVPVPFACLVTLINGPIPSPSQTPPLMPENQDRP